MSDAHDQPPDDPSSTVPPRRGRVTHRQVLDALEARYDHQSARNVLGEALRRAEMKAAPDYSPEEASRLAWGVAEVGPVAQRAIMRLLEVTGAAATADVVPDPEDEADRLFWN